MAIELLKPILFKCSRCGDPTEWDMELGDEPLCVFCWDKASDKYIKDLLYSGKRKYYQEHKEKLAAWHRKYQQEHKEKLAAGHRKYYQEHKEKLAAGQRKYYQEHKEEVRHRIHRGRRILIHT